MTHHRIFTGALTLALAMGAVGQDTRREDGLQRYSETLKAELRAGKISIFADVMALQGAEAEKFWTFYPEFETRLFALGERRLALTRSFREAAAKGLDEARAQDLAQRWFRQRRERLDVLRDAHRAVSEDLSPVRAAQFVQIENRLGVLVDVILASALPLVPPPTAAQRTPAPATAERANDPLGSYLDTMRADLRSGKVNTVAAVMRLDQEEAEVFWTIYQDYECELFALGDGRLDLASRFAEACRAGRLDDEAARKLTEDWFALEAERDTLLEHYHAVNAAELSFVRAAQFAQIEHRFQGLIDLMIAAKLPLIDIPSK